MAKIIEDTVVIRISRLVSDDENSNDKIVDVDVKNQLKELFTELAGPRSIVEVEVIESE